MYKIKSVVFFIHEKSLNKHVESVQKGNLEAFNYIDEILRPKVKRMTYKHTCDPYEREDLEQMIMEYLLHACFRYVPSRGDFHNYALRTAYLELKKQSSRYYKICNTETPSELSFFYVCDETETYDKMNHIFYKNLYEYMLKDQETFSDYERAVLKYLWNQYTFDEIGKKLNTNRKSVQNTLYRIIRKKTRAKGVY